MSCLDDVGTAFASSSSAAKGSAASPRCNSDSLAPCPSQSYTLYAERPEATRQLLANNWSRSSIEVTPASGSRSTSP
jgi:hypothetical protein